MAPGLTPEQRIAELEKQLRDTNRLAAEQKKRDKARILELDTCYSTMLAQRNGLRAKLSVAERSIESLNRLVEHREKRINQLTIKSQCEPPPSKVAPIIAIVSLVGLLAWAVLI